MLDPRCLGLATMPDPSVMGLIVVSDLRYLDMTSMPDFINNKQIRQLYTLVSRREKRKKKHK